MCSITVYIVHPQLRTASLASLNEALKLFSYSSNYFCPLNKASDGGGQLGLLIAPPTEMGKPLTTHDRFIWLALQNSSIKAYILISHTYGFASPKVQPKERCQVKNVPVILRKSLREAP